MLSTRRRQPWAVCVYAVGGSHVRVCLCVCVCVHMCVCVCVCVCACTVCVRSGISCAV